MPDTTPKDRIFSASYAALFIRMWKFFLKASAKQQKQTLGEAKITTEKNSMSSNLEGCIEINGHSLVIFHNQCRDMGSPQLFLPSHLNSQASEDKFRTLRFLSTTKSTVVNMDVLEILQRSTRLTVIEEAPTKLNNFLTRTKKPKEIFIPNQLLDDNEIRDTLDQGFNSVKEAFLPFRKYCHFIIEFMYSQKSLL